MSDLVLNSLEVRNFRTFAHLCIGHVGRVNLIVGKNNVGKSSLLEALWLYAHRGEFSLLWHILGARDEGRLAAVGKATTLTERVAGLKYLFYGRKDIGDHGGVITVGPAGERDNALAIDVARSGVTVSRSSDEQWQISQPEQNGMRQPFSHVFVRFAGVAGLFPLNPDVEQRTPAKLDVDSINCVYASAGGLNIIQLSQLWDNIALTDLEEDVLAALRVVAPDVERLGMVGSQEPFVSRIPVVKVFGENAPIPLRSMGEGMNRLFGIALALVNAKNGLMLIDEVDTGIHYSVQTDLWRLIFELAHRLNVQVFATTHSWDCIQAFQEASDENAEEGVLIRLENKNGEVAPILFDERKLGIATREHIEVR